MQKEALLPLIDAALADNLNIVLYSGNTYENLLALNDETTNTILSKVHYLVDGPFILEEKNLALLYRGSNNQRIIDLKRSTKDNLVLINKIADFK